MKPTPELQRFTSNPTTALLLISRAPGQAALASQAAVEYLDAISTPPPFSGSSNRPRAPARLVRSLTASQTAAAPGYQTDRPEPARRILACTAITATGAPLTSRFGFVLCWVGCTDRFSTRNVLSATCCPETVRI